MPYRPIGYRAKKPIPAEELEKMDAKSAAEAQAIADAAPDATDSARKLAEQHNINLADIPGSGVDGRITKADVEAAVGDREAAIETAVDDEPGGY